MEAAARREAATSLLQLSDNLELNGTSDSLESSGEPETSKNTQTELSGESIAQLTVEQKRLEVDCHSLARRIRQYELTEETLVDDDARVKFYTGLPSYEVLAMVFQFVSVLRQSIGIDQVPAVFYCPDEASPQPNRSRYCLLLWCESVHSI